MLIQIGNSQGIRIPKVLIEEASLDGVELKLEIIEEGLLIKPIKKVRSGWKSKVDRELKHNSYDDTDSEWMEAQLSEDDDWEW